jgi:hypothetical protein
MYRTVYVRYERDTAVESVWPSWHSGVTRAVVMAGWPEMETTKISKRVGLDWSQKMNSRVKLIWV